MSKNFLESTYGSPGEKSLHEVWGSHEFCYTVLEDLVTKIDSLDTVIDLGCGSGEMLARLALLRDDVTLVGIDFSDVAVDAARRRLGEHATIIKQNISTPLPVVSERVLVYSSGFTSNLFLESAWSNIVSAWFDDAASTYIFVYDTFWWNPDSAGFSDYGSVQGNEASFRWSAMRGEEKQVARIRDTRHSDPTEVVSFNHWLRHPFLGGNSNLRVRELLHNSVNTGQGFTTESCTRVVTREK